ncbi:hypothetical protein KIN20_009218 [Parelaphostrongylus tenuis]|uniref:tRNA (guanine(37)-N1)-methyltransferase n=1 Tax=Parelaphostrongylus tenuis TaxID=148309 RepID=A0AAD5QL54_PARTN|nr:hypothetical protein KIN20_009218 [Parelaphostrongylus tenuis]
MRDGFVSTLFLGVLRCNRLYRVDFLCSIAARARKLIGMNHVASQPISTTVEIPVRKDSTLGSSPIKIPDVVRGMTDLKKDLFVNNILFTVMKLDATKVSLIQRKVRLEKYLIRNLGRVKCIMDADDPKYKLLYFDPSVVNESSIELKSEIESKIKQYADDVELVWETRLVAITFEDWDLKRIFRAVLPKELEFSSYSQIGHIVHVNLRENLLPYKKIISQILLEKVSKCRTVVNKFDSITNEYRNFELDLLAGDDDYVTELIESGVRYRLDFSKVFWNSRLSHEHERVVKLFNSRSLVYDICAGVGPFVLPALKRRRPIRVLANDLNPESVRWLKENATLNKIPDGKIEVHNLDAPEFIRGVVANDLSQELVKAKTSEVTPSEANILMNLPAYAINFLPSFKGLLSKHVSSELSLVFPVKVYCYLFVKALEDVPMDWYEKRANGMIREFLNEKEASIELIHHVRTVSSRKEMFCVQLNLSWDLLLDKASTAFLKRNCSEGVDSVSYKRTKLG